MNFLLVTRVRREKGLKQGTRRRDRKKNNEQKGVSKHMGTMVFGPDSRSVRAMSFPQTTVEALSNYPSEFLDVQYNDHSRCRKKKPARAHTRKRKGMKCLILF